MRNAKNGRKEFAMAGLMSRSLHGSFHASEEGEEGIHVGFRGDSQRAAP